MAPRAPDGAVELIRVCAQADWRLRSYVSEAKRQGGVSRAELFQSMFGPDKDEWPGSPVGFSWEMDFFFHDGREEYVSLDVVYARGWTVSAERSRPGEHGPEQVEELFERRAGDAVECASLVPTAVRDLIAYCEVRKRVGG